MLTSEYKIEKKACALVVAHLGVVGSKLKIQGSAGYPDRIFWLPGGKPLLIEFKMPGEKPRPIQLEIHKKLKKLGYNVQVHDNEIDAFQAVIDAVDTSQLSKKSKKILDRARERCAVLRSRAG